MRKIVVLGGAFAAAAIVLFAVGYLASGLPAEALASITREGSQGEPSTIEGGSEEVTRASFGQLDKFVDQGVEIRGYMLPLGGLFRLTHFLLAEGRPEGGLERLSSPERVVLVRLPEGRWVDSFGGVIRARGRLTRGGYEWQGRNVAAWELLAEVVLAEVPR